MRDFGAVGDSITDDTQAIQHALSYCSDSAGGGVVLFPPGTYHTTYSVMYGSNTKIVGCDGAKVFCAGRKSGCSTFLPVSFDTNVTWVENVIFENLTVNGLSVKDSDSQNVNGIGVCRARNVRISGCRTTKIGYHFVDIAGGEDVIVENCHVSFTGSGGIQIDNITQPGCIQREMADHSIVQMAVQEDTVHSRNISVVGNVLDSCFGPGVHLHRHGGCGVLIENNTFRGCGRGVSIDSNWGSRISIKNNTFMYGQTNFYRAVEANGGIIDELDISGNDISRCLEGIVIGTASPLLKGNIVIEDNTIDSVWLYYNTSHAIRINGKAQGRISGNRIANVGYVQLGKGAPDTVHWMDSTWEAETARVGILLSNCRNLQVTNNLFSDIYGVGVVLTDTCEIVDIINNRFSNFAAGVVLMNGSNNVKISDNLFSTTNNWSWFGIFTDASGQRNRIWQNKFSGRFLGTESSGLEEIAE